MEGGGEYVDTEPNIATLANKRLNGFLSAMSILQIFQRTKRKRNTKPEFVGIISEKHGPGQALFQTPQSQQPTYMHVYNQIGPLSSVH